VLGGYRAKQGCIGMDSGMVIFLFVLSFFGFFVCSMASQWIRDWAKEKGNSSCREGLPCNFFSFTRFSIPISFVIERLPDRPLR